MALKQEDGHFVLCSKQVGVGLNRECIYYRNFFLNRVRGLSPKRLTYAQILVEYPRKNNDKHIA